MYNLLQVKYYLDMSPVLCAEYDVIRDNQMKRIFAEKSKKNIM